LFTKRPYEKNRYKYAEMAAAASHSEATLALAKKESAEHMHGMQGLYDDMRKRPLIVKAYAVDDANAPADAKIVHFVRHGQGFHNLMADIASSQGREWVQVRCRLPFVIVKSYLMKWCVRSNRFGIALVHTYT
jgi:hypothetical protein